MLRVGKKVKILRQELQAEAITAQRRPRSSHGLAQGHIAGLWQEVDSGSALWPWTG